MQDYIISKTILEAALFIQADSGRDTVKWEGAARLWARKIQPMCVVCYRYLDPAPSREWLRAIENPMAEISHGVPALPRMVANVMLNAVNNNGGRGFSDDRFERLLKVFENDGLFGYPDSRAED